MMLRTFTMAQKAKAFDQIVELTGQTVNEYMSHRPAMDEMADWSKEDLRQFFLGLVDMIESTEYAVTQTIEGVTQ